MGHAFLRSGLAVDFKAVVERYMIFLNPVLGNYAKTSLHLISITFRDISLPEG